MTEVHFHFNVPDRVAYTCRLLRKVSRLGKGVTVTGPAITLQKLDRLLWTFEPLEFIPHALLRAGQAPAPRLAATPIWLAEQADDAPPRPVMVHLGDEPAIGFESFERLVEVVSTDPAERDAARQRWRHYASRGYAIERHDVAA